MNEREALIKVRDMLRSGELTHIGRLEKLEGRRFNMGVAMEQSSCGTVCCIGGWVATFREHPSPRGYVVDNDNHPLYYPDTVVPYSRITPEHAVKAIDNYLKDGDPRWAEILGDVTW